MKKYYTLKFKPDVTGDVIKVDSEAIEAERIRDYIASYTDRNMNLQFRFLRKIGNNEIYEVRIPCNKFSFGGGATAISPAVSAGWYSDGKARKSKLRLDRRGNLSALEKGVYVDEITERKARELKQQEFLDSMQLLWIAGL